MSLISKIQNLCRENKTSIPKLEKMFKWGHGSIYRWETNSPSIDKLVKVADYFGVSLDYLLNRQASAADADALELAEEIKKLPPDMRKIVDTVIEANKAENEGSAASGE